VAGVLRQRIATGGFPDGVVDERALAEELGASRNAVREALGLLRDEGLIRRRRGVGTRVVTPTYGHGLDRLAGLAEALAGYGTVTNEVRAAHTVAEPPASVAAALDLKPGVGAVLIQRVRRLDGVPVSLDTTYLTPDIGRSVLQGDLEARDVFVMIEQAVGCRLGRAEVEVRAATVDPVTAALLDLRAGDPIFAIDRLTRLSDGTPVDVELLQIRGDRMTLHATLYRGPATAG
jgi:GntR family transcriptional regulator